MRSVFKYLSAITLALTALNAAAMPTHYITHNDTDLETNAFISGEIASPFPTIAHTTRKVAWKMVRLGCGRTTNGLCAAVIKLGTDTPDPIFIGTLYMDMDSGEITPQMISANGYTLQVNGIAEVTIFKE